jgi:SNF2 family DNA or RNA helicase
MAANKIGATDILAVCPAIAVPHWHEEWLKWGGKGNLEVRSYDRAKIEWQTLTSYAWNVVIADEAHFAKNPEAVRTKLIYGKGGLGWHTEHLWALSGTPAPKHAGELWAMLFAFGVTKMTYQDFVARYCRVNPLTDRIVGTKEEMIPELKRLLATVMLRRTRKEVAPEMPDIDFNFLEIGPKMADLKLPANVPDDQLLEWLESHESFDRENRIEVAMAKVGPLGDEIEFAIGNGLLEQTVVFGWHIEPLETLARQLRIRGMATDVLRGATTTVNREAIKRGFAAGETQVVVAQILAAGTAIDLSAARHGYFLEMDWVPGNNVQAANRLINMDKLDKVTFDVVTARRSADDRVQKVLLRRTAELAKLY